MAVAHCQVKCKIGKTKSIHMIILWITVSIPRNLSTNAPGTWCRSTSSDLCWSTTRSLTSAYGFLSPTGTRLSSGCTSPHTSGKVLQSLKKRSNYVQVLLSAFPNRRPPRVNSPLQQCHPGCFLWTKNQQRWILKSTQQYRSLNRTRPE